MLWREPSTNPYGRPDQDRRLRSGLDTYCEEFFPAGLTGNRLETFAADVNAAVDNEIVAPFFADMLLAHDELIKRCPGITKRRRVRADTAEYIDKGITLAELPDTYGYLSQKLHAARQWGIWGTDDCGDLILHWDGAAGLVKLCPDDAREEGQRVASLYGPRLLQEAFTGRQQIRFGVFTTPNVPLGELKAGMDAIWKRFNDRILCYRKKNRPFKILGALVTLECPLSKHGDWNIHLNALIVFADWPSYKALRAAWGYNVELKKIGGRNGWRPGEQSIHDAIAEVVKYPLKAVSEKAEAKAEGGWSMAPGLTQWPYAAFYEWYEVHRRHRRTRGSGCLYNPEVQPPIDRHRHATWAGMIRWRDNGEAWPDAPILHRPGHPAVEFIQRNKFAENFGFATVDKLAVLERETDVWFSEAEELY